MLKGVITGVLLGTSVLLAQEKPKEIQFFHPDSIITTELADVVITADKEKQKLPDAKITGLQTIYYNDANKIAMSNYSGVFTIIPVYSRLRINNMDPKFTVLTYQDIPLIMDNTQLHGGISIINSQMSELNIKKTAYSSKYSAIGGVMEVFPKDYETSPAIVLASDFIERSGLYSDKFNLFSGELRTTTAFRNIGVPVPLEDIVSELKILPDIYETSHNTTFSTKNFESEIFLRISNGSGDFFDDDENIGLKEHSSNNFFLTRQSLKIDDRLWASIKFAYEKNNNRISYDLGDETADVKNYNKNITFAGSLDGNNFSVGSRIALLSNATLDDFQKDIIYDVYGEYKHIIGNILFEPSLRIITNGDAIKTSQGITGTYFIKNSYLGAGYGHPVNMIVVDNSSGEKNYRLSYLGDQYGDHYLGFVNIKGSDISEKLRGIIDEIDVSYYHKYFNAFKQEGGSDKGYVNGWDFMLRNFGKLNYSIKYSIGNAILNGGRMNESVEEIATVDVGFPMPFNTLMNLQYMYNGGYNVRIKADNSSHTVGKAQYISAGITYRFEILDSQVDFSITAFNLLRAFGYNDVPEFARYKVGDNVKSVKMPPLGDMRFNVNVKF
jgi:hypothetical protein